MLTGKIIEFSLGVAGQLVTPHKSPVEQQEKLLHHLLHKAEKTSFGLYYDFHGLLKGNSSLGKRFRDRVPVFDYNNMYDRWWNKTLAGHPNIAWPGTVKYFALSSGTSDATSKHIPITRDMFDALRKSAFRLFSALPAFDLPEDIYTKSWLAIGGSSRLDKIGERYEGYLSGINASKRPFWSRAFYKPGTQIASIVDFEERTDSISKLAANWDVGLLVGIPHWIQIVLEKILDQHGVDSLVEIWPNLTCFVSGGVDPSSYRPYLDKLAGRPLIFINTYLASEGFIAFQVEPGANDMQLLLSNGIYYEFVPYDPQYFDSDGNLTGDAPVVSIGDVREDVDYAVLLTTCAGAWRYMLGDVVRFTDASTARIRITGRTKYYLNLCTEHLTGDNMTAAIASTEDQLGIEIPEFMIAGLRTNGTFVHRWYVATSREVDELVLTKTLDANLSMVNDDYKSERQGVLRMELVIVPRDLFYDWQQVKGAAAGIGQVKVPRVLNERMHEQWSEYLQRSGYSGMTA